MADNSPTITRQIDKMCLIYIILLYFALPSTLRVKVLAAFRCQTKGCKQAWHSGKAISLFLPTILIFFNYKVLIIYSYMCLF